MSKILVYGAGPLGSVFAARLQQGGNDVSLLARGQRLADLRAHGIVLHDRLSDEQTVTPVRAVEALEPPDAYDLVLVIMRKNQALEILPVLAANEHTPNVLFLMNNAAGSGELVDALGRERVLVGFPGIGGYREGHVVHYMAGTPAEPWPVLLGEVDGQVTARTREVARILATGPGFQPEIRSDMDAWLKYHVAILMPSLAPALYAAGTDHRRYARTRDLLVLTLRAIKEGFQVLRALGYPVTPAHYRFLTWIPEPLFVLLWQNMLLRPEAAVRIETALTRHAGAARDEVRHLVDEFQALAATTKVPTRASDYLYTYLDPAAPLLPEGSATIPLRWSGVLLIVGTLATLLTGGALLIKRWRSWLRQRR